MKRSVLFSVHPKHADAIAKGEKRVEIRRGFGPREAFDVAVFYATAPRKRVVCAAHVEHETFELLTPGDVETVWDVVEAHAPTSTRDDVFKYLKGAKHASLFWLRGVYVFDALGDGFPLEHLGIDRAPQSFCYVDEASRAVVARGIRDNVECALHNGGNDVEHQELFDLARFVPDRGYKVRMSHLLGEGLDLIRTLCPAEAVEAWADRVLTEVNKDPNIT